MMIHRYYITFIDSLFLINSFVAFPFAPIPLPTRKISPMIPDAVLAESDNGP